MHKILISVFLSLLLLHCGAGAGELKGSKWLCNGSADEEERAGLKFPSPKEAQDPAGTNTSGYVEVYHKDGGFEALDPVTGENLLEEGVKGSFELSREGSETKLLFTFRQADENGEEIVEKEPYKVLELTAEKYHSLAEAVPGVPELFESKCIRLGDAD